MTDDIEFRDRDGNACHMALGTVVSVRGSHANIGLKTSRGHDAECAATVGRFLGVRRGDRLLIGVVIDVSRESGAAHDGVAFQATAHIDLMGEIRADKGVPRFERGVSEYPAIGDDVSAVGDEELKLIFNVSGNCVIDLGHLQQSPDLSACADVNDMLSKHFAVLGTTGVGKSSAVALILQEIMRARPDVRIFLLDAHNEYAKSFGERAHAVSPRNLKLPFWLFNFDEIVDVLFAGRPGVEEEVDILAEVIPYAKSQYGQVRGSADRTLVKRADPKATGYTLDRPLPYRLADLLGLLDERMGKLENRSSRMVYQRLMTRIETVSSDPRYAFMFENANVGGDTMADVLSQLFRLPANGKPMTILQLAGFPSEVVDAVVSVICRMAFDFGLWSDGAAPLLFLCEEAHRYMSADHSVGFGPTRRSISRIAKEGRKYGVFLGLVTQRPAELDATILSQCSTLFAMRMTNDRDQALLRSAVSDGAANLLAFLPTLATREALAFGEGVALPTRLKFKELPAHLLPRSEADVATRPASALPMDQSFVAAVLERWRGAAPGNRPVEDFSRPAGAMPTPDADAAAQASAFADATRARLAKKLVAEAMGPHSNPPPRGLYERKDGF